MIESIFLAERAEWIVSPYCPCDISGVCAHPQACHCDEGTRDACRTRMLERGMDVMIQPVGVSNG